MNDETKLFLVLLAFTAAGIALVTYGFGWSVRTSCIASGIMLYAASLRVMAILWRRS